MTESFDVFLSHNSKDKPAVRELAEALRARGLKVWLDEWELVPGRPWQVALEEVIETCRSSAVLVGKDGLGPWHAAEMRGCLTEFVRRKLPVIPVLLPGAPADPRLPLFLTQATWVDLRGGLTEKGIDQLQWGATGQRPDRSKLSSVAPSDRNLTHAGQTFTEPLTGIRFLWIPGGRFQMGGRFPEEQPVHWVRISPFWLGETPVTNRQYAVFVERTGAKEPIYWGGHRYSSPDQPVVGLGWEESVVFCQWLSSFGRVFLLPSEAQWEFAARGTDGREYPWGNEPPDATRACFGLREESQPAPVGFFPAGRGPFGTLDQAGNVYEWCRDAWEEAPYAKRGNEPLDPVVGDYRLGEKEWRRVTRGGCWRLSAEFLRSAYRSWRGIRSHFNDVGFRVAAPPFQP